MAPRGSTDPPRNQKASVVASSGGGGTLKPTVVELTDNATVDSPHTDVGGTATTTVGFKMNVWADGDTMTLTPTGPNGVTFSAVTVPAEGIVSANSTCTATAGLTANTNVPISMAFSGGANNAPSSAITVSGSNQLAVSEGFLNLPWLSTSQTNGWTQVKNLPQGTTTWFQGNDSASGSNFQVPDTQFDNNYNTSASSDTSVSATTCLLLSTTGLTTFLSDKAWQVRPPPVKPNQNVCRPSCADLQ